MPVTWRLAAGASETGHAAAADAAAARLVEAMASFDAAPIRRAGALFNVPEREAAFDTAKALSADHRERLGVSRA